MNFGERLKNANIKEKADDEYMESLRLKDIFQHKEDIAKIIRRKNSQKVIGRYVITMFR